LHFVYILRLKPLNSNTKTFYSYFYRLHDAFKIQKTCERRAKQLYSDRCEQSAVISSMDDIKADAIKFYKTAFQPTFHLSHKPISIAMKKQKKYASSISQIQVLH
jgi:hypothetical protein